MAPEDEEKPAVTLILKSAAKEADGARQRPEAGHETRQMKIACARRALAEALRHLAQARQRRRSPARCAACAGDSCRE